jgi:branched-chain amino acid transport system substrate-binding protein
MADTSAITKTTAIIIAAIVIIAAVGIGVAFLTLTPSEQETKPTPTAPSTIKIGLLTHLTGPVTPTGLDILRGAQLAVEEINAEGGVFVKEFNKKIPLQLIIEDQQSSRDKTVEAASRLVNFHNVDIIVGGFGSAFIIAAQPVIAEAKTPYVITGVSTPRVVERTDIDTKWFVLYQATGPQHGESIVLILAEAVKPVVAPNRDLRVAVLYQDSPFGEDFFLGINKTIVERKLPLKLVYVGKFKVGETDYRALLSAASAAKPDVIVPIGFIAETIDSIKQGVRDLGLKKIWGPVCVCVEDVTYYKDLGKEGEYSLIQTYFGPYHSHPSVKQKVEAFMQKFKERWGVLPGSQGISAYDAVYVAAKAIEIAGTLDKTKIRDALRSMTIDQLLIPVPGGKINFGDKGQQRFDLYGVQLFWDENAKELRPKIIWPASIKETDFKIPPGFEPGE